jgi:hypothetical protein
MKTILIFLVLLIVGFSCGTNNKPVSDAQKEKIKGEVKEVVYKIIKGCEDANFDLVMTSFLDSPDFIYINNGYALNYKELVDALKPVFSTLINQKVTIVDEKYAVVDHSTVIYTNNSKFLENYKDGHAILSDPTILQMTFRKINDKWMAVNGVESSVRKDTRNTETSKELNQVELNKQFLGTWKAETGKDTSFIMETKTLYNGFEAYLKTETKGKIIMEGKSILGYDKKTDKLMDTYINSDNPNIILMAAWFTSANTCEQVLLKDISNPENATFKLVFEFKSPDLFTQTTIRNNKPVRTDTYTRIK